MLTGVEELALNSTEPFLDLSVTFTGHFLNTSETPELRYWPWLRVHRIQNSVQSTLCTSIYYADLFSRTEFVLTFAAGRKFDRRKSPCWSVQISESMSAKKLCTLSRSKQWELFTLPIIVRSILAIGNTGVYFYLSLGWTAYHCAPVCPFLRTIITQYVDHGSR